MFTLISSATILINPQTLLLTFSHHSIREMVISLFKKNQLYYRYAVYKTVSSYLPNVVNVDFQRRDIRGDCVTYLLLTVHTQDFSSIQHIPILCASFHRILTSFVINNNMSQMDVAPWCYKTRLEGWISGWGEA